MPYWEQRPTILLIDDDPETREILGLRLEEAGFNVFTARGELDGTARARAIRPDVIVLEFGGRDSLDSLVLGRRVRERAGLSPDPALVVYAGREDGAALEGKEVEVGRGEYVILPEDNGDLMTLLRRLTSRAA